MIVLLCLTTSQQLIQIARYSLAFVINQLNFVIFEDQTHCPSSISLGFLACRSLLSTNCLGKVYPENIEFLTFVNLNRIMRRKPAEKGDEIAVAMPPHTKAHIRQRSKTSFRKECLSKDLVLGPLELLVMHKKQFDHAGVSRMKSELVFCVEVLEMLRLAIQASFQKVCCLDMLTF